ncbi:MAG: hypothetical protein HDT18_06355 [Oscillibacter sp.]|nr:hypothetical protein [Oscillibacter sp.]
MEKFIEKLDSYKILNNLLPGFILVYLFELSMGIIITQGKVIENLLIYYFVGMIVSRIGSVIVEPLCKKVKLVKYADYGDYVRASKKDKKIDVLSETNNMYRSILAALLIVLIANIGIRILPEIVFNYSNFVAIVILGALFFISYRKQTNYIAKRVRKTLEMEDEDEHS